MKSLRLILGDQISRSISALDEIDIQNDIVMLCEVLEEAEYVKHHPKKIAFLFSAMRHFAEELKAEGINVLYIKLDDPQNTNSFDSEIVRAISNFKPEKLIITQAGEWRVTEKFKKWQTTFLINVEIRPDFRFLCSIKDFKLWAGYKKQLRMEFFYREMRRKYNILIDEKKLPVGGNWNYDKENRHKLNKAINKLARISHQKSDIVKDVLELVKNKFSKNFGDLEPFHYAVTREQALIEARHFMNYILPDFGSYQDAMLKDEPYLYHSLLSTYLNAGLLLPLELCKMAEEAYYKGSAPLNSVEGYIRQILGWREFIRGIYWNFMPSYAELNFFAANNKLPSLYWGKPTKMFCLSEAVNHTKLHAYSHHIQRLMITGNFALIASINISEICDWYLAVYSDAYEWVELPNTLGMALYADGGIIASKPYAASAKYIKRMSNYCKNCYYDPDLTVGEKACPFNALYWNFMETNREKLKDNQRMGLAYFAWDKFDNDKKKGILDHAQLMLEKLDQDKL